MKYSFLKVKSIASLFVITGLILFSSCSKEETKTTNNDAVVQVEEAESNEDLIIGSWVDKSPAALHFSIHEDGTASSDNMKTLLYKSWALEGDQISFVIESIGNKTSSNDTLNYTIEKLTNDELVLRDGDTTHEYTKD
ncbi:lipocalin family protein [Weeksellaceae bacterium KMM 9713]|uniref:Lipocalin family protein n=1 Tax=Profundicola chukchiensis TaxID=2961959 RepID=A0A9X4MWW4_9FLAO|nr:lipocalin family protein [Profundicola chukchiensis]MDG4945603.1 lipocalin family protein [Profundicola chukchiensis]